MEPNHHFRTCQALEAYGSSRELWDVPVFEVPNFFALPTVGPMVEGWLLVVPREPVLSLSRLSESQFSQLEGFLADIKPVIESTFGPVSMFEHGPSAVASAVGCGVNYAHLHVVPINCDLLRGARELAENIHWEAIGSFREITRVAASTDYWFLKEPFDEGQCHLGTCAGGRPVSQLFRRVIARHLGLSSHDWKQDSGGALIAATREKLRRHTLFA
jgi:ATP adenylyltransferase